jgi:hypothetical protein
MDEIAPPAHGSRTTWYHAALREVAGSMPGEVTPLRMKLLVDGGGATPAPKPKPKSTKTTASGTAAPHKVAPSTPKPTTKHDATSTRSTPTSTSHKPTGGTHGAAKGAGTQPPKASAPIRPHNRYEIEEQQQIKSEREAAARTAASLDKAVPPKQRKKLLAEQKRFFGVTTMVAPQTPVTASTDPTQSSGGAVGARPTKQPKGANRDKGGADGPSRHDPPTPPSTPPPGAVDSFVDPSPGDTGGAPSGTPVPGTKVTTQQRLDYFKHHPYYVAGSHEVWKVDVVGTDVHLSRTDDPKGSVDYEAGRPNYLKLVDEHGKRIDGPPTINDPASSTGVGGATGASTANATDHRDMVAMASSGEFGVGTIAPKDVRSKSASGFVTLSMDGTIVSDFVHSIETKDDSTLASYAHIKDALDYEQSGMTSVTTATARHEDGSSATVRRELATGAFRPPADPKDPVSGFGTTTVSQTDARGATVTTSSDRPRPRSAPRTLDEVRTMQDELGLAESAKVGTTDPIDPHAPVGDRIFANATRMASMLDADEIAKALMRGEAKIGKDHPEQVQAWGDAALAHTRAKFASWGLDAADGNQLVPRNWIDKDLPNNAYYDSASDKFVFGVAAEGTPFGFGTDVISHEFTHRIDHANATMPYQGEQGAIDESLADTMAAAVDTDYQVGEDVVPAQYQRDMSIPSTVSDFVETDEDFGGVHTNSSIPNYAAYLIGRKVGHDELGAIYAKTIDEHLDSSVTFEKLATGTWRSARELYGADSAEVRAVEQAWDGVLELHGSRRLWPDSDPGTDASHDDDPTQGARLRAR